MAKGESSKDVIVVTGASGFLGTALLAELGLQDRTALGIVRRAPRAPSLHQIRVIDLSLESDALITQMETSGATTLIHAALPSRQSFEGATGVAESETENLDRVVLGACRRCSSLQRAILVSSSAVYGPLRPEEDRLAETRHPVPNSRYGRGKLAQEERWERANLPNPTVVARVFNITGPGEPPSLVCGAIAEKVGRLNRGAELPLRNSESVRDFSDVRDAAGALLGIADMEGIPPSRVNICSGNGITISHLARMIIAASGREVSLAPDGSGGESRSIGNPNVLIKRVGWRNRFSLQESASAVWLTARAEHAASG